MSASDFPMMDTYTDCAGKKRSFLIEAAQVPSGWLLTAREQTKKAHGYEFSSFSPIDPYLALAAIRRKIRKNLAIKYLEGSSSHPNLSHDQMAGVISYDEPSDSHGLIVDGQFVSMEALARILQQYEGWEFRLSITES